MAQNRIQNSKNKKQVTAAKMRTDYMIMISVNKYNKSTINGMVLN